jgi:hypothetical protein
MEVRLRRLFQEQIVTQCKFAIRAETDIYSSLQTRDLIGIFYGIQNLLNAAANIEKALYGRETYRKSRLPLREILKIKTSPILAQATKIRNHHEHYDEKIEEWYSIANDRSFADLNALTVAQMSIFRPNDRFRWYEPVLKEISFWNEKISLPKLMDEIRNILVLADQELRKPLPPSKP